MQIITQDQEWEDLLVKSEKGPVVLLKHSTACGVSASAHSRISQALENGVLQEPVYVVIVQNSRGLSNRISEDLGVTHHTPQILVFKEKKPVFDASHFGIDPEQISSIIASNS